MSHISHPGQILEISTHVQTVSTLGTFILAMVLYPEVQAKAQAELDRVIGSGRLPEPGDKASLPYIEAVIRETLRWHPVVPVGM